MGSAGKAEVQNKAKQASPSPIVSKSSSNVTPDNANLITQYPGICRRRYRDEARKQNRQFLRELTTQEQLQRKAFDGVRIHRNFCNPVLNSANSEEIIKLTIDEKRRLEALLKDDFYRLTR